MYDYFKKKYEELIASIFDPIFKKILALSWLQRVVIVCIIFLGFWSANHTSEIKQFSKLSNIAAHILLANKNDIPFSHRVIKRYHEVKNRLFNANVNDESFANLKEISSWSAAQLLMSIANNKSAAPQIKLLSDYINENKILSCNCWSDPNNNDEKQLWTFISGWVFAAYAEINITASTAEIEFLLSNQNADGAWSSIPNQPDHEYESTYATAWALIGLKKQSEKIVATNPPLALRMQTAVDKAAVWLIKTRQINTRWKPYPNLGTNLSASKDSDSISGLVMHALHQTTTNDLSDIDQAWLQNIPTTTIDVFSQETTYADLHRASGEVQNEHYVQFNMPWMLVGTLDAYVNGNLFQKASTLDWMERTLMQEGVNTIDTVTTNWYRTEPSIAINYMTSYMTSH